MNHRGMKGIRRWDFRCTFDRRWSQGGHHPNSIASGAEMQGEDHAALESPGAEINLEKLMVRTQTLEPRCRTPWEQWCAPLFLAINSSNLSDRDPTS
jgi:hypothetical protein